MNSKPSSSLSTPAPLSIPLPRFSLGLDSCLVSTRVQPLLPAPVCPTVVLLLPATSQAATNAKPSRLRLLYLLNQAASSPVAGIVVAGKKQRRALAQPPAPNREIRRRCSSSSKIEDSFHNKEDQTEVDVDFRASASQEELNETNLNSDIYEDLDSTRGVEDEESGYWIYVSNNTASLP